MSIKLAAIFSDNMVLQHGIKIPVWGWSDPGDRITVELFPLAGSTLQRSSGQAGQKKSTVADKNGKWNVILNPLKVSLEHRTMKVSSKISKSSQ